MNILNKYEQNLMALLDSGLFYKNNFLILYASLITIRQLEPLQKYYNEKHHIIPRAYYTQNSLNIDNTKTNLVKLTLTEHILAHYYLSKCFKDERLRIKSAKAALWILNSRQDKLTTTSDITKSLNNYIYADNLEAISANLVEIKEKAKLHNSQIAKQNWANPAYKQARLAWWTEARRTKVGQTIRQFNRLNPYHQSKAVICIETGKIFNSIKEAETFYNTDHHISKCCKNQKYTCGGYHWAYTTDADGIASRQEFSNKQKKINTAKLKVYCVELNKIFESASIAAKELNANTHHIHECCSGRLKTHKKMHWRYYNG